MTPTDAAIAALSTAQRLLLEPHGLTEAMLLDAIAEMHAHRIDDSDLYFQYSQAESWGMEEGIVKSGSYSIDQGVLGASIDKAGALENGGQGVDG